MKLSAEVVGLLEHHRQLDAHAPEAGGLLLGRRILDSRDVVVDYITEPSKGDKQSRFEFLRRSRQHQTRADELWESSEGTINLLGGWHTHPEPYPTPSCIDLLDWQRQVKLSRYYGEGLFFLIVGQQEFALWELKRTQLTPTKLQRVEGHV